MLSGEPHEKKRIESLGDIRTFLVRLNYALNSGRVRIVFQKKREVDDKRNERFTNRYTIHYLFPGEDEIKVLKRELSRLRHYDYIETVQVQISPSGLKCVFLVENIQVKMYILR
ncbi:MAG: hypothetical protein QM236_06930 [Bacillota bacterium]|jgi:hypothetical protein|nr:hypothetical protein [Bacillota bacterium]